MPRNDPVDNRSAALLNKPGIMLPKPGVLDSYSFFVVLFLIAGAGAFGCFYTAFQIELYWGQLTFLGIFFVLICAAQFLSERRRWAVPLMTLAIWGFALWRNFDVVLQGFFRTANAMLTAYSGKLNLREPLPLFSVEELPAAEATHVLTVFSLFLAFLFFWLLSWLFIRHKSVLGAFCLTGVFLLAHLAFSILPNRWCFGILLLFWAFLLLAAPSLRQRSQLVENGVAFQSSGDMFFRPASLALLPVLALCMIFLYSVSPPETYERPQFIVDLRRELTEGMNLNTIFRGDTKNGERVEFSSLGDRYFTGKIALQVRHEWQNGIPTILESPTSQKDYLKSFVGSVYTGESWEKLPEWDSELVAELWGDQNPQTLPADLMQTMPGSTDPHYSYFLSVRKLGKDPQSIYSPYGLYSPLGAPNNMEYVDDGFLQSPHLFSGTEEYALSAVAMPTLEHLSYYAPRFSGYFEAFANERYFGDRETLLNTLLTLRNSLSAAQGTTQSPANWDLWQAPDWAKEQLEGDEALQLLSPLEQYNAFVYAKYTQLPDDLRDFLTEYAEESGLPTSVTPEGRASYLQQVQRLLAQQCTYSLSPPALPKGEDFVQYFLTESRTGYCVHFATAATVLLRAAGIPARYAEGYAVPTSLPITASEGNWSSGSWVNVPDYNAHAWVEVYWGGIGWVPVEMTPAGPMVPAAYANATGPSENDHLTDSLTAASSSPTPTPTPAPAESAAPTVSPSPTPGASTAPDNITGIITPSPSPGSASLLGVGLATSDGRMTLPGLLLILLLVSLPFLLIILLRPIRLFFRRKKFRQKDRNKAALCLYSHLLRLYWANTALPGDGVSPPEELEGLALKARFSAHTLTREELKVLTEQVAYLEKKLNRELPKYQRLKCKYLLALF